MNLALVLLLFAPMVALTGVAAATLAMSSYLVVLPVLTTGLKVSAFDALFVCFLLDFTNGVLLSIRYRNRLKHTRFLLSSGLVFGAVAALVACLFGMPFIENHEKLLKGGVGYLDFLLAIAFAIRAYRIHKKQQRSLAHDSLLSEPLNQPSDPETITAERMNGNGQSMDDQMNDVPLSEFKMLRYMAAGAFMSSLSGVLGMSGGNFFAMFWIGVMHWETIPSTAAGSVSSTFVMFAMMITYIAFRKVSIDEIYLYLAVGIPVDVVSVLLSAKMASRLPEQGLSAVISVVFLTIGIFVTVFTAVEKNK